MDSRIHVVVAHSVNGVIGRDGRMPWHVPGDLAYFRRVTMGHPVVMGRRTYESIGRALPGRTNIVVTRDRDWSREGVLVAHSLERAIALAREQPGGEDVMVIGGGEIFEQVLPIADIVDRSIIQIETEGDTVFPDLGDGWVERDVVDRGGFVTATLTRATR